MERPAVTPRLQFCVGAAGIVQGALFRHQHEGM